MGNGFFFNNPFSRNLNEDAARRVAELSVENVRGRDVDQGRRNPFLRAGSALLTTATRGLIPFIGQFGPLEGRIDGLEGGPGFDREGQPTQLEGFNAPTVPGGEPTADPGSEFERFNQLTPGQRAATLLDNPEVLGTMDSATFDRLFNPQEEFIQQPRGGLIGVSPEGRVRNIVEQEAPADAPQIKLQKQIQEFRNVVAAQGAVEAAPGSPKAQQQLEMAQSILEAIDEPAKFDALRQATTIPALEQVLESHEFSPAVAKSIRSRIGQLAAEDTASLAKKRADLDDDFAAAVFKSNTIQDIQLVREKFSEEIGKSTGMAKALDDAEALLQKGPAFRKEDAALFDQAQIRGERASRLVLGGQVLAALNTVGQRALGRPGDVSKFLSEFVRITTGKQESGDALFKKLSGGDQTVPQVARIKTDLQNLAFGLRDQIILDGGKRISDFEAQRIDTVAGRAGSGNPDELRATFGELMRLSIVAGATNDIFAGQSSDYPVGIVSGSAEDFEKTKTELAEIGFPVEDQELILRSLVAAEQVAVRQGPTTRRDRSGGFQ